MTAEAEGSSGVPTPISALPLFPLQTVLFPGGLLRLKVFEARYLDLMSDCLRNAAPFGVVCLLQGSEVGAAAARFEKVGVLAKLKDVDAQQPGILQVQCCGGHRVSIDSQRQSDGGLWLADAAMLPDDARVEVPAEQSATADALRQAIASLASQEQHPFLWPHRLEDAGWVANRWCEILPISLAAKQRLMVLEEPLLRLKLVDEYLRGKGIVG